MHYLETQHLSCGIVGDFDREVHIALSRAEKDVPEHDVFRHGGGPSLAATHCDGEMVATVVGVELDLKGSVGGVSHSAIHFSAVPRLKCNSHLVKSYRIAAGLCSCQILL